MVVMVVVVWQVCVRTMSSRLGYVLECGSLMSSYGNDLQPAERCTLTRLPLSIDTIPRDHSLAVVV